MPNKQVQPPSKLTRQSLVDAPDGEYIDRLIDPINRLLASYQKSIDGSVSFNGNLASEVVEVSVLVPDPWIVPTLGTNISAGIGYVDTETPKYMKHPDGVVELRGVIETSANKAVGTVVFTFPEHYRPAQSVTYTSCETGGATRLWTIGTNGDLVISGPGVFNAAHPAPIGWSFLSADATAVPAGCWPKNIKTRFNNPPIGVVVMSVTDEQLGSVQVVHNGSLGVDWSFTKIGDSPQVKINNIANLPYNRRVRVKLLIIGN